TKRRAALRDAVRMADERAAGIPTTPGASLANAPDVSDLMLTKLATGVKEEMLPERLSDLGPPPSSPGDAAGGSVAPPRGRGGFFLALGATTIAVAAIAFVLLRSAVGSSTPTSRPMTPQAPPPAAAPTAAEPAAFASGTTSATGKADG